METIIKVNPSELDLTLLNKIKEFIGNKENVDVTISLTEYDPDYVAAVNRSMEEGENEKLITFTMEEFVAYTPQQKK
jgi:hypothetical protein